MTGSEFNNLMTGNGFTQATLAARWGVARQTIGKQCNSDLVDPLYADAIKAITFEKQAEKLQEVIDLFK